MSKNDLLVFKPVEALLDKVVNRYFAGVNRKRDLDGYARLYLSLKSFHEKVTKLFREVEKGMVDNGILEQPRQTYFMRDIETKIEAVLSEDTPIYDERDLDTSDITIFNVEKINFDEFQFMAKQGIK